MTDRYRPNLSETFARWLYSTLVLLLSPLLLCHLKLRQRSTPEIPGGRLRERLAMYPATLRRGGILLHCASVGEVVAASRLVKRLLQETPDIPVTITTMTDTGAKQVEQLFQSRVQHLYLPLDLPCLMARLIRAVAPQKVLITEVELWPNLIDQCWRTGLPVFVINARMTDRSAARYAKLGKLFRPMLMKLTGICAQGERDYRNYIALGAADTSVTLTHNMKFDLLMSGNAEISPSLACLTAQGQSLLLGGSTHDPEERVLLETYQTLSTQFDHLRLVLVPRHPQRFDEVWQLCLDSELQCARFSHGVSPDAQVILIDQMGLLAYLYSIATIAFVGGSIADRGGHNALEAAAYSVPIVMGPHTYNNPEICAILAESGALNIVSAEQVTATFEHWLRAPEQAKKAGRAGYQVIVENAGAIDKTLSIINQSDPKDDRDE